MAGPTTHIPVRDPAAAVEAPRTTSVSPSPSPSPSAPKPEAESRRAHSPSNDVSAGGTRARQRAETRERLFETALREFRDVGFGAAQIDRIARSAGVARGTFYFHFPTKDDVLLELARRINRRVATRVAALSESSPSLRDVLIRANDAIMDEHSRVGEAGLLGEMLSLYVRRPHDLNDPTHNLPTLADELAKHLQVALVRGEIESTLAPDQVAIVFMSSLFGVYTRIPPGEELRSKCEALIDLLVRGLRVSV